MELINYFATPEGRMTMQYGPKGLCWDYDDQGNTIFTEFGRKCRADENTTMVMAIKEVSTRLPADQQYDMCY